MVWALFALMHSLFRAVYVETARYFQDIDPWVRAFWQSLFGGLVLLPFLPLMAWPDDGRFYFAAICVALILTAGQLIQLNLSAQQNGRISAMSMPVEAFAAFVIWLAITPSSFADLWHDLLQMLAVLLAFGVATIALLIVRPNDAGTKSLLLIAPVGMSFAVAGVVTKLVLPASDLLPVILPFVLINFLTASISMLMTLAVKRKAGRIIMERGVLRSGAITGVFAAASFGTFVAGVALAPNPGYTSFMAMMLPVWMIGFHKLSHKDEKASPVAAFLIVIAALMLILAV